MFIFEAVYRGNISYLKKESFDYFAFMKAQKGSNVLFYTLMPFDLQKT
jgi:hypothetical protein